MHPTLLSGVQVRFTRPSVDVAGKNMVQTGVHTSAWKGAPLMSLWHWSVIVALGAAWIVLLVRLA